MNTAQPQKAARVAVLGLGYIGCVTAACLAKLGHRVIGVDRDAHKIDRLLSHEAPFYEPGLESIVRETTASGSFSVTDDLRGCLGSSDIVMICVGTPSESNGNVGLTQLRRVCEEVAASLPSRTEPLIVVIRSTVFPGTCEQLVIPNFRGRPNLSVVTNPEFLREGNAVRDFFEPSLLVVGGENHAAASRVADLYKALDAKPFIVSLRAAEMIKYACNCFHGIKISFANEIGTVCGRLGVNMNEVMEMFRSDVHLNISPAYLKPGFAFGGSCLPKDLRALTYKASRLDVSIPMLASVLSSNQAHLRRAIDAVLALPAGPLGIFGLAFKEDTDDLRESPVVALVERLIGKGRQLHIFDPHIQIDRIYGQNRSFALDAVPHIGRLMSSSLEEMLAAVDHVIVTQPPKPEWEARIEASGKAILHLYDLSKGGVRTPFPVSEAAAQLADLSYAVADGPEVTKMVRG